MSEMSHPVTFTLSTVDLNEANETRRIDAYVRAHRDGTPFHLTGWSRAVEKACGQKARYLKAESSSGELVGILPLTEVRSSLFGKALVSAGFAVGGGLLCDSDEAGHLLVAATIDHAKSAGFPTVELRGNHGDGTGWIVDTETYLGFSRALAADNDAELLAIPRKQRAEVRKAIGLELQVSVGSSEDDRAAHYTVYAESVRNLGTPVFPRTLFDAVLDELGDEADILTVRKEGRAIASVLSLYWRGTVLPYWGGGTADARPWRANDMMYYALMLHARSVKGCSHFDFGRSKAGTGPAAFKRNWGFEPTSLSYAKYATNGGEVRDINPMSAKYRFQVAAWQKLPLWLANRLGPLLSRGLG
jgi:FemAB-related protein (PEP-CTERM system-associated)